MVSKHNSHLISSENGFFCDLSGKIPLCSCFTAGPCHSNSFLLCFVIPFIALPLFTLCPRQLPLSLLSPSEATLAF